MKIKIMAYLVLITLLHANNILVSNVYLNNQNTLNHTVDVVFDISWDNSWRTSSAPNNYDAAWIFVKYKDASETWKHATLSTNGSDYTPGTGATIDSVSDGKGVFLYRDADGSGTFSPTGNAIRWEYGTDGLGDMDQVTVKVFAIEMVYIPQGSFWAGSDTSVAGDVNSLYVPGASASPFQITSTLVDSIRSKGEGIDPSPPDDAVLRAVSGNSGIGIDGDGGIDSDNNGTIDNASFPTGYNAFYLMKYEVSQIQYVEYLNTLTRAQQDSNTQSQTADYYAMSGTATVSHRNGIRVPSSPGADVITFGCDLDGNGSFNQADDGMNEACNWVNWLDMTAYLDWAGLRPYTELEFVKAVRGPASPTAGEYVWGNSTIQAASALTNDGQASEIASSSTSNVNMAGGIGGPMRTGSFAQGSTSRAQAGAGYYGNMDMAGNVWEVVIPLGTSIGRAFNGQNGDGKLTAGGNCDIAYWNHAYGAKVGQRGGVWAGSNDECRIANRNYAARQSYNPREYDGFRGARTP